MLSTHIRSRFLWLFFAVLLGSFAGAIGLHAQDIDQGEITEGLEYDFGIPHCWKETGEAMRGISPVQLWVSSKVDTRVTITNKALGINQSYAVTGGKVKVIPLTDALMNLQSEVSKPFGVHLKADAPVALTVFISYRWSGEAYRVIPVDWLGKRYYTLNLYQDKTDVIRPSQILIVATKDETKVKYTPSVPTERGTPAGKTAEVTLQKGETYLIQAQQNSEWTFTGGDLSGTYIEASEPIGVISGHTKGAFPRYNATMLGRPANFMRNMIIDMMWPVELLGTEYISAPIKYISRTRGVDPDDYGDLIRFVATEKNTQLYQMRQDGTGAFPIGKVLDKGEYHDIVNQEAAAHYRSNKPVLVGQYGKAWRNQVVGGAKGENPLNPSRNGCGMMLVLAPIDHWTSYTTFKSADNLDNFCYVTFASADEPNLVFNGKSFRSFFGSSIKQIAGTNYSYAVKQIPAGDNTVEGSNGAKFACYAYGNYDYTKDGFAYGYPTGMNFATKCPDTLIVVDNMVCGNVKGLATALPDTSECAQIFSVRMVDDQSKNYTFRLDDSFVSGAKVAPYTLTVIDPRQPAIGVVKILSRSGRSITKTYNYIPEQLTATPTLINFGTIAAGDTLCRSITLTNPGSVPVTVKSLRIKLAQKEFFIKPGNFPITIDPKSSASVEVCASAFEQKETTVIDSVLAELSCYDQPIAELRVRSEKPKVFITDVNFGEVPVNTERKLNVDIKNVSDKVDVVLTAIDNWSDKQHFLRTENLNFPITLKAGETYTFQVVYNPLTEINIQHSTRATFTVNTDIIKIYSDWTGTGIEAGPVITGFDWKERRVLDNFVDNTTKTDGYEATIEYGNTGNTQLTDVQLTVSGADGQYFTVPVNEVPRALSKGDPMRQMKVFFKPEWVIGSRAGERPYEVTLTLSGSGKSATAKLNGVGVQPHIEVLDTLRFGSLAVNSSKSDNSWAKSTGSMKLSLTGTITGIRVAGNDAAAFVIDPGFFTQHPYPIVVPTGSSIDVPITFTPNQPRTDFMAELIVESDAPEQPKTILLGEGFQTSFPVSVEATDHDFGKQFITLTKDGQVTITNTSATITGTVIDMQVAGNDANNFLILSPQPPFDLGPGQSMPIDVRFGPTQERSFDARIDYTVKWAAPQTPNSMAVSKLIGVGEVIHSLVKIGEYHALPGENITVNFELKDANMDVADVREFKAFVRYNPLMVSPKLGAENIITKGTLTDGWRVLSAEPTPNKGEFYVDIVQEDATKPGLRGSGTLFSFDFFTYLSVEKTMPIPCEMQPIARPYVFVDNLPGLLTIDPSCASQIRAVVGTGSTYTLSAMNPNPATGTATIEYSIGLAARTVLAVYNMTGERVATLVNQVQQPGSYEVSFDVQTLGLPSGAYSYRLESGQFMDVKPLIIQK